MLGTVTADHDERRAIQTLLEFRCEALILLGSERSPTELRELNAATALVLVGRRAPTPDFDIVRSADHHGMEQVVEHLVGHGHRAIAHIDGGSGTIAADRRRGYRTAMRRHGLAEHTRIMPGGTGEQDGWRAAERLLASNTLLPTAVATFNSTTTAPSASSDA